jgi:spermidine synthase
VTKNLRIASLLFFSGFCALIYQTVWLRELRLIMGASTPATATVLAIFMGGMGMGGLHLSKRADKASNPLAFYANLEAGIAIFSGLTPLILMLVRSAYLGLGGAVVLGMFGGTVVRILISIVVLIVPTFLMGGTLPAAAKAARSAADISNKGLALLYGANTLGAVTGAVFSTFQLLELYGNRKTLWMACLINLVVFVAARAQSRKIDAETDKEILEKREEIRSDETAAPASGWIILTAAAVSGFAFFLMELVWYRMLSPILGGSTYTFGTILSVALLGIGGGGIIYSLKTNRLPSLTSFAWTCALEAFFLIIPFAMGDKIAEIAIVLHNFGFYGFWGYVAGWTFICVIVVLPVSLVAGYQFPLLISLLNPKDERFAWKIGLTYGCNTAGSIAGSLLGGFGLMPLLTAPGAWKMTSLLLVGMSLISMIASLRKRMLHASVASVAFLFVAALSVSLFFSEGPTAIWRHSGIGTGRGYPLTDATTSRELEQWKIWENKCVLREWDGMESSVALANYNGLAFVVNGKVDGHSLKDAGTQIMSGLIASILQDEPKRSFVVGLGTGSTAGWLASVPSMERVDVAEIEPSIRHIAEACGPVNNNAMKNPKINVMIGDGREIIMSSQRKYDIIASEPSNPYRAGISSLFTLDYYTAVARRLNPGGIFVHWIQAYEIDATSIWIIYNTLSEVFPYIETWQTSSGDIALVASMQPFRYDVGKLRLKIGTSPYRDAIRNAWGTYTLEGFLGRRFAGADLAQKIRSLPGKLLNTDDHNYLEFAIARSLGSHKKFNAGQIYVEGRKLPNFYGPFSGQDVNWAEVERSRLKWISFEQRDASIIKEDGKQLRADLEEAISKNNWKAAREILRSNGDMVPFDTSMSVIPIVFIENNDTQTEKAIQNHASYRPLEAIALRAIWSIKNKQWDPALALSLEFIENLRTIPWASEQVITELFPRLPLVAKNTKGGAEKLTSALLQSPFAVYAHDDKRYEAAFTIAKDVGTDCCAHIGRQGYYYNAGNPSFLGYLYGCYKNDKTMQARIIKEVERLRKDESPNFGGIMEKLTAKSNNQ